MRLFNIGQIKFCAEECERQKTGPMAVYQMLRALGVARHQGTLVLHFILDLGLLVDPDKNMKGVRTVPVTFPNGNRSQTNHPDEILDRLQRLILTLYDNDAETPMSCEEFYEEFEQIHPFIDGNGRVGAILYNFINNNLDYPVAPPDVFAERI